MKEDEAIEHSWVSKSVEKAQKKVEERNFGIRKNLLDYDEVRDVQRNYFYKRRQQILEGLNLRDMIFEIIEESVDDSVAQYLDPDYVPTVIAEWARKEFHSVIEPQDLRDNELAILETVIRDRSREEAKSSITTSLSEFMDPDASPEDWDYQRLAQWAEDAFDVKVNSVQLRKMDREQIREALIEAAMEQIERKDCQAIAPYLVKHYAPRQLAEWANNKFDVKLTAEDLIGKPPQQAADFILEHARESYRRREYEYPVEYALEVTLGGGGLENIYVSEQLSTWVRGKYGVTVEGEYIRTTPVPELHRRLVEISRSAAEHIEQEIDQAIEKLPESKELVAWVTARFRLPLSEREFDGEPVEARRRRLHEWGRAFMRSELTELERAVLLQIYDSTWKDHLYAMDLLRESIGLRATAERDPRIEYKKEGSRLFGEFMKGIRDRVTDVIFKVRQQQQNVMRNVYDHPVEHFQRIEGSGVSASPAAQEVRAQRAGMAEEPPPVEHPRDETKPEKIATIVNQSPKVGRNDPCPCGSGKKFKQCCGKEA
jgi:preprotein translocase subunit SecA